MPVLSDSLTNTTVIDSMNVDNMTVDGSDTIPAQASVGLKYKLSKDAFSERIKYGATDSSMVDVMLKQIHLYGNAYLEYEGYKLNAGYILVDFDHKEASASFLTDAAGNQEQFPLFNDGNQEVKAEGLRFNFETKKGLSYGTRTRESEFFIHGARTKFVSKDDSLTLEDKVFQEDAFITTCDHDHPHYGIRTRKIKILPNKLAVIGFSQLEIAGVPTPLILPFGLFPLVEGQSSGLIFPSNYEYNETLGFGLRGIGYYFPINDYFDITVTGDIYTRGSHRIQVSSNYKKRYKYSGNVLLEYANNIGEDPKTADRTFNPSFRLYVKRDQDRKAHPYRSIGGTIDIQTGKHQSVNYTDYSSQVRNILSSNFYYRNSLPAGPFSLNMGFNHRQDTQTGKMDITLPDVSLNMSTIYPFKRKEKIGNKEYWYEKINLNYDAKFKNYVSTTDSTLFEQETLDKVVTGLRQSARTGASFTVMKYFNVTPNAGFEQIATLKTLEKNLNEDPIVDTLGFEIGPEQDTIFNLRNSYVIDEDYNFGFKTLNKFNAGITVGTQIFGTKQWSKGWFRGIRHTIKPSITANYATPTYQFYREVRRSLDPDDDDIERYNPFQGGAFSSSLNQMQLGFNYSITNFLEGKIYSKKEDKIKKVKLWRQLRIGGNYNYAADSLQWSPVTISGNTELLKGYSSLRLDAAYDFYERKDGRLIDQSIWESQGKLLEFNRLNLTITNRFTINDIINLFNKEEEVAKPKKKREEEPNLDPLDRTNAKSETSQETAEERPSLEKKYHFTLADYIKNFSINHSWRYTVRRVEGVDTSFTTSHTIGIRGSFPLTDHWNVRVDNISYDLANKSLVYPSIGLTRDLHCWDMSFSWQPERDVYSFFIGVKSNNLSFLKYNYGERNSGLLTRR